MWYLCLRIRQGVLQVVICYQREAGLVLFNSSFKYPYISRQIYFDTFKKGCCSLHHYSQARKIESVDFPSLPTKTTYFPSKMKMPGSQIDLVIYSLQQKNQILVKIQIEVDYSATRCLIPQCYLVLYFLYVNFFVYPSIASHDSICVCTLYKRGPYLLTYATTFRYVPYGTDWRKRKYVNY